MKTEYLTEETIAAFIDNALREDVGDGDHSTLSSIPQGAQRKANMLVKSDGIIAGIELAKWIFHRLDSGLKLEIFNEDGDTVTIGDIVMTVSGNARSILTAERLVLNCMQRMSGIATYTHTISKLISHTKTRLLDTRKTTPNFRICEKWAVQIGGGQNHRFGLFDMIMLKDNHIDYAGGVKKAIESTKKYLEETGKNLKIEVETRNLDEVKLALEAGGVEVIMLDNMLPSVMKKAVEIIGGKCKTEASGGITEKNIVDIAETGVNYISVGALTHSYQSMDISLKAVK
ncbi:carboxylating nicotinate-nucleotide diphosphorylase [Reichenbachiella versicolor]|uniref:carboxylating nicotinate-nucleotide diphosphorylase n=1 Tax=Reichenbachiella versicolor TaxID=1821036 RepID=UPI000D6DFA1E|nr:carboxylating nicotinate-nucleotide diphosphorylase [Reichenbachiella versicolor]